MFLRKFECDLVFISRQNTRNKKITLKTDWIHNETERECVNVVLNG